MTRPFKDLKNSSNVSVSSYETAWSSSFNARRSINDSKTSLKDIKNEPFSDNENEMSILENNISMMSVTSPKSPKLRTPSRKPFRLENPKTPGDKMLEKVNKEEDRSLLRQFYPEMFRDGSEPPENPRDVLKKVKEEQISEEEDHDDKENCPPGGKSIEIKKEKPKERPKKIVISSDSEQDEEEFDNYLKSLRKEEPPKVIEKKKKFVVQDDWSSESRSEDDEEEEDDEDEEYRESSPEIDVRSVQKKTKKKKSSDDEEWFLQSLSPSFTGPVHADAKVYLKENALRQKKQREGLLERLHGLLHRRIFSEIPSDKLKVVWNARLRKSAGQCRNHSAGHSTVEMSPVVCTTAERLRDTLIHEMCHAAVWVVDKLHKEGHGPGWKRWGARCSAEFPSLPFIERCHSYEIDAKFFYVCENDSCAQTIKRQSKSLDTSKKACGKCLGRFVLYRFCRRTNSRIRIEDPKAKPIVAPEVVRRPTPSSHNEEFTEYAKLHYWDYKGLKHSEVMKKLGEEFEKIQSK